MLSAAKKKKQTTVSKRGKAVGRQVAEPRVNPANPEADALGRLRASRARASKAYRDRQRAKRVADRQPQRGETP
jgi:hypothetical protein